MAAIDDWNVAMEITTDQGTWVLNDPTDAGGYYMVQKDLCESGAAVRAEKFDIPQSDGSYLRRRFMSGYRLKMGIEYWSGFNNPACATSSPSSRAMNDVAMRHLRAMLNGGGRLYWTPAGAATRIIDDLWLLSGPDLTEGDGYTGIEFELDTEFPYGIDFTQTDTVFTPGDDTKTLTNAGTAPFYPVWKVYGPTDGFEILNNTTNEAIIYSHSFPGAHRIASGHYIEINTFRNTVYLDGNGANYKPGIEIANSTFFTLGVGANEIIVTGDGSFPVPTVHCLWQSAWF